MMGSCLEILVAPHLFMFLSQEGDETASRLLEYLMHNCHHDNRSVFRNNLEIIKTLMELWRDRLQVPTKYIVPCAEYRLGLSVDQTLDLHSAPRSEDSTDQPIQYCIKSVVLAAQTVDL